MGIFYILFSWNLELGTGKFHNCDRSGVIGNLKFRNNCIEALDLRRRSVCLIWEKYVCMFGYLFFCIWIHAIWYLRILVWTLPGVTQVGVVIFANGLTLLKMYRVLMRMILGIQDVLWTFCSFPIPVFLVLHHYAGPFVVITFLLRVPWNTAGLVLCMYYALDLMDYFWEKILSHDLMNLELCICCSF